MPLKDFLTCSNLAVLRRNEQNFKQVKDISAAAWDIRIGKAFFWKSNSNQIQVISLLRYSIYTCFCRYAYMFMGRNNCTKQISDTQQIWRRRQ